MHHWMKSRTKTLNFTIRVIMQLDLTPENLSLLLKKSVQVPFILFKGTTLYQSGWAKYQKITDENRDHLHWANKKFIQYALVPFNSKFPNFLFSQLLLQPRKCKLKFEKYWIYFFMAGGVISCMLRLSDTHKHLSIWKISHHHSSDYMSSIDDKFCQGIIVDHVLFRL